MRRDDIEAELVEFVEAVKAEAPSLEMITVFGSYNNGNWSPARSDIDTAVLVGDEHYNLYRDLREAGGWSYAQKESLQREELRLRVKARMSGAHKERFQMHLITPRMIPRLIGCNEGRGDFGRNILRGRLIYPEGIYLANKWRLIAADLDDLFKPKRRY